MIKPRKILFIGVAALIGILLVGLVVLAFMVDPNALKPRLVELVQEKKQRTLSIEGDLRLSLFPRLGIALGPTRLSEHQGEGEFAAVQSLRLKLAWWPLLRGKLVVDGVEVEGLRAHLRRFADGRTNFDDLLGPEQAREVIRFDIDRVRLAGTRLDFEDLQAGRRLAVTDFFLHTGRLKEDTPTPFEFKGKLALDAPRAVLEVALQSDATFSFARKHYAWRALDLKASGEALGMRRIALVLTGDGEVALQPLRLLLAKLVARVQAERDGEKIDLAIDLPRLVVNDGRVEAAQASVAVSAMRPAGPVSARLALAGLGGTMQSPKVARVTLEAEGKAEAIRFRAHLITPLEGALGPPSVFLPALDGDLKVVSPHLAREMRLGLTGSAAFTQEVFEARLTSRMDETKAQAQLRVKPSGSPRVVFDVEIDRLDVDRYLRPRPSQPSSGKPLDLSVLRDLDLEGSLRVGSLKMANLRGDDVRLGIRAQGGRLALKPVSAAFYGDVDLGKGALDDVLRMSVGGRLKDPAGRDRSQRKGITVPVRLLRPFGSLHDRFDPQALLAEAASLTEKKEEGQEKIRQERFEGFFGR